MLELEQVREQLRVDAADTSDALLILYVEAAIRRFEHKTGRKLFKEVSGAPTEIPANAVFLDADISLALLLLVGHWNANREATSDLQLAQVPLGFDELANPYRWWPE